MGAGVKSQFLRQEFLEPCVHVSDLECIVGCQTLLEHEAFLVGASTGGVITALDKLYRDLPQHSICVLLIPDRGERYLDTVYSESWVSQHFPKEWESAGQSLRGLARGNQEDY